LSFLLGCLPSLRAILLATAGAAPRCVAVVMASLP